MEHHIIYKKDGIYAAFPQLDHLEDGRVAASFSISFKRDHHVIGDWAVLASDDGGRTWAPSDDPSIPHNWPAPTTRECSDRFNAVLKDGTYLCAGSTGSEVWDEDRRGEAEAAGMQVFASPVAGGEDNSARAKAVRPVLRGRGPDVGPQGMDAARIPAGDGVFRGARCWKTARCSCRSTAWTPTATAEAWSGAPASMGRGDGGCFLWAPIRRT